MRADVDNNLLFVQTEESKNSHSLSVFCYDLKSGKRLWQTDNMPSGGEPYLDKQRKTIEIGQTFKMKNNYLVLLMRIKG